MGKKEINFKNSKGKKLEGNLHRSENSKSVVILAHGFTSNKNRDRYISIGKELNKNGIDFLRFNFGGSGESYETEIDIGKQIDDLKSAINLVKKKGYEKIGILGESLGGLITLKSLPEDVDCLVLWAPVTHPKTPTYLERHPRIKEELEKRGEVVKEKDGRKFILPKKYFEDRKNVDSKYILKDLDVPCLILHGEEDELVPLKHSKKATELNKNIELKIISNVGHKVANEPTVVGETIKWFNKYLK